jgi:cell wall-associated NlpC family hydrolase
MSRARSVLNLKTVYKLGQGGRDPSKSFTRQCDCSGFIAWAIGIPRELPPGRDKWLSTDEYWTGGSPTKPNLCKQKKFSEAAIGDLLVYPDGGSQQGHIALVTQIGQKMPSLIIHCSNGNYRNFGDAIRITDAGVFLTGNHQTRVMRIDYDVLKKIIVTHV